MKPGKTRLKRRKQVRRWLELGDELEKRARIFAGGHANTHDARVARHWLFRAALDFATAVDGEET